LASSCWCIILLIIIIWAVIRMQKLYSFYYPGTPGVKVDIEGLAKFFKIFSYFYWSCVAFSLGLIVWSLFTIAQLRKANSECPLTFYTTCGWAFVHTLNVISSISMAIRMKEKYDILVQPPPYQEHERNGQQPYPESRPPPTYAISMSPTKFHDTENLRHNPYL
jgi:hypothetical protein